MSDLSKKSIESFFEGIEDHRHHNCLRARAKITLHVVISSSSHLRHILKTKNLEIAPYYSAFCSLKYTR